MSKNKRGISLVFHRLAIGEMNAATCSGGNQKKPIGKFFGGKV
jgi:hypothetical protein